MANWHRMTEKMCDAMGYDQFGNAHALLATADRLAMYENGGVPRAGGQVVCSHCGVTYAMHPVVQGALWATRTCKDGIVKL